MADLGKVGITYDSNGYVATTPYEPLTVLKYTDGGTYMSIAPTLGHLPTDTTYWAVLVPPIDAGDIDYDNATSGLTATKVQSAIDELDTNVDGKAPTSHASTATTYGVGSTTNYGHCKTINNLTSSAYVNGESLSAYQGKLLNDSLTPIYAGTINGILFLKCGNIMLATINNIASYTVTANAFTTLGTVSTPPKLPVSGSFTWVDGGTVPKVGALRITAEGNIQIFSTTNSCTYVNGFLVYMI